MSRQSDQLEMLHNKLSHRYGPGDMLCARVFVALESCRKFESTRTNKHDWSVPYTQIIATHRQATQKTSRH